MADFPTVAELKDFARSEIQTADDSLYTSALAAAISEIKRSTHRDLTLATGTPSARVFVPASCTSVRIDDCVSITSVVNDGTTFASNTYQRWPLNGRLAGEARPYEEITLINGGTFSYGDYDASEATITVTADWGWASIPERVRFATLILGRDILGNRDVKFGLVAVTDAAGISARTNTQVRAVVQDYSRVEAWGIA